MSKNTDLVEVGRYGAVTNGVNDFSVAQRTTEVQLAWAASIEIDFAAGNDFYIDTTSATGEMTITVANVPTSGTNQSGVITIEYNATYTSPTWDALFKNTPTDLTGTETNMSFGYQIVKGSILLGSKVEWS